MNDVAFGAWVSKLSPPKALTLDNSIVLATASHFCERVGRALAIQNAPGIPTCAPDCLR